MLPSKYVFPILVLQLCIFPSGNVHVYGRFQMQGVQCNMLTLVFHNTVFQKMLISFEMPIKYTSQGFCCCCCCFNYIQQKFLNFPLFIFLSIFAVNKFLYTIYNGIIQVGTNFQDYQVQTPALTHLVPFLNHVLQCYVHTSSGVGTPSCSRAACSNL